MSRKFVFAALFALATTAQAKNEPQVSLLGEGMELKSAIVPIVPDDSQLPLQAGQMYYMYGVGLKVVNPAGVPELVSSTGASNISTTGANDRLERAAITFSGSTCSTNGAPWLVACVRNGVGDYTVSIDASMFSATPVCQATILSSLGYIVRFNSISATSVNVITGNANISLVDSNFQLLCMGPR